MVPLRTLRLAPTTSRRIFFAALLAAAAGVAVVHGRGLNDDFVYDDLWTVVRNPTLRTPFPLSRFFTDASTAAAPETGMGATVYRPLPTLSFLLNFQTAGPKPWTWRLPDFLLHALNGVLVFLLLVETLKLSRGAAALGAAVFLFHPVQVESAVWITQRSNLMCAAAGLGSLLLLSRGNPWGVAAYAASLLSKETAVTLAPFLALAALSSGAGRPWKNGMAVGTVLLAAAYLPLRAAVTGGLAQRGWRGGLMDNFLVGQASWLEYLKLSAWPVGLTASHDQYVGNPWENPAPWVGLALLAAWLVATALSARSGPRGRRIALAAAWIPVTLAPHLGLLPLDTFVAERFLYLPMAGWAALIGLAFDAFPRRKILFAPLLALPLLSFRRTAAWRSDLTLWQAAVRTEPGNAFARLCLADAFYARGRWEEAVQAARESLTLNPSVSLAFAGLNNLSDIALKENRPGPAFRFAERALRIRPDSPQALHNRAAASARGAGRTSGRSRNSSKP